MEALAQRQRTRFSLARWLKLVGVVLLALFTAPWILLAEEPADAIGAVAALSAFSYLGSRRPGIAGILLLLFTPLGFFGALLSGAETGSEIAFVLVLGVGLPLVSGAVYVAAAWVQEANDGRVQPGDRS